MTISIKIPYLITGSLITRPYKRAMVNPLLISLNLKYFFWIKDIRADVVSKRRFIKDEEVVAKSFFNQLWRRQIPTPLKEEPECLQKFAVA